MAADDGALLGAEQVLFHELWVAARPRLSAAQVAAGREQSVYPAQAEQPLQPRAPRLQPSAPRQHMGPAWVSETDMHMHMHMHTCAAHAHVICAAAPCAA